MLHVHVACQWGLHMLGVAPRHCTTVVWDGMPEGKAGHKWPPLLNFYLFILLPPSPPPSPPSSSSSSSSLLLLLLQVCGLLYPSQQSVTIPSPWASGRLVETIHPVRDNYRFKETISFPGARHLFLKLDPRCSSQYDYDKVGTV